MTPREGQKRLMKLLGKRAMWRDNGKRTSPEQRAEASAVYQDAHRLLEAAKAALYAREAAVLAADTEYQALRVAYREAHAAEKATYGNGGYRITLGVNAGIGFMVRAEGDNWAEAIRALESAKGIAVARES